MESFALEGILDQLRSALERDDLEPDADRDAGGVAKEHVAGARVAPAETDGLVLRLVREQPRETRVDGRLRPPVRRPREVATVVLELLRDRRGAEVGTLEKPEA